MMLFFTELLVRGTLLCLLVALTLLLMRRAAATYRHLLCTLALCGLLTLPLVQELLPPLPLLEAAKPVAIAEPVAPVVLPEALSVPARAEPIPPTSQHFEPVPSPSLAPREGGTVGNERSRVGSGGFELSFLWPLAWALGAAILLLRLTVALVRLRTLAKRSQPTTLLGTQILVSERITTPLTWGVRRPVILLPTALLSGETAVAQSALRHEKAHIARRDWLWHLLAEVVCALCWFQPGAWWLRRRLRAESERACDDRVLLSGVSGPDYAAHLLEILKVGRASTLAPGMAAVGSMELRVKHILDPKKPRRSQGMRLALTAVLGLVLLPLASLKVAAKPGERPASRLQAAVELLAPKLTFLTPSALLAQAKATLVAPKPLEPMPLAEPTLAQPNGTLAMPQPLAPTQVPPAPESPKLALNRVVWEKAVDGLQPGILLTGPGQVSPSGKISYQVLIRNTTNKPIEFIVQCLPHCERHQRPYLVPDSEMARIGAGQAIPAQFRTPEQTVWMIFSEYVVTLAPQESVQVPGDFTLALGRGGNTYPYIETVLPGKNWLVQPVKVHQITPAERTKYTRLQGEFKLTKIDAVGKVREESEVRIVESGEGKLLFPRAAVEVVSPASAGEIPPTLGPTLPLDKVIWNEAVDGLAAGFLLTSSPRVPMNSKLTYQTLVRNTSNKPISFLTRLLQYDGYEAPTVDGKPTKGAKRGYPVDPLYSVTLAPGESVIVPAQNGRENLEIYVGEGGSSDSPSIAAITPGHLKIVQPIKIYRSPENLKFADLMGIFWLSKVSPEGRVRTEGANRATGLGGGTERIEGGTTLEAYIYLEVGTLNAAAERNASAAVWGKVDRGLQCGIRVLSTRKSYEVGDTLEAELLWRNVGDKKAHWTLPRQLDLWPIITGAGGQHHLIDSGARFRIYPISTDYEPSEVRSLGILKVTLVAQGTPSPKSNKEPGHITLAPGTYFFSGSGGVSGHGDPCPHSGEVAFTVVGSTPQPQKANGVVWGKVDEGIQCGIRMLTDQRTFKIGDTLEAEIFWRNPSDNPITRGLPREWDIYPVVEDKLRKMCDVHFGQRQLIIVIAKKYQPGEVCSLGVLRMKLVPKGTPRPTVADPPMPIHVVVDPGTYTLSGHGGVSGHDPRSGEIAFTVVGNTTPQPKKEEGVAWGTADKGMQCGIRLLNPTRTFRLGDSVDVETLWRNSSSAPIKTVAPSRYDLYPSVHDAAGHWHSIDFGGRVRLRPGYRTYAPGEAVSLGVTNIRLVAKNTPSLKSDGVPAQIALAPGSYKLLGSGGVSAAGGPSPKSGEITLTVVGDAPQATKTVNDERIAWGKVDRGLQCGIRMLTDRRKFLTGDTLEAEVLWRNASGKTAYWVLPRQLDIVSIIREASGRGRGIDSGARFDLVPFSTDYAPGEVRSLGILKVTLVPEGTPSPESNKEPGHITLAPGTYFFSGSGGVGDPDPRSGEVAFTVVGSTPQPQKADGIAWGKEVGGYRYGLRDGGNLEKLEVWVQNLSAQKQTLRYPIAPSVYRGTFLCYDAAGKETRLEHPGPIQSYGTLANRVELAPQGKALLYADPLKPWQEKLQSGQVRSIAWVSADGENKTGRLAFRAPEPTKSEVELSLRLPKGMTTFAKLSQARFEVILRNRSDKPLTASWITPANFGFYGPEIFTNERVPKPIPYVHTVGGPYRGEGRQLASGETIVLGTIQIPREARATLDALPRPGLTVSTDLIVPPLQFYAYEARFSLGITVSGKGEQKLSARLPFPVARTR